MARIRTIKPEFWEDEKIGSLSFGSRLLYIGLWTFCDDYGVCRGNIKYLKSHIFSYDTELKDEELKKYIDELISKGLLKPYIVNEESFVYLPKFCKHQKISHPSRRLLPGPPKHILEDSGKIHECSENLQNTPEDSGVLQNTPESYIVNSISISNSKKKEKIKEKKEKIKPTKPTLEKENKARPKNAQEVTEYAKSIGYNLNGQKFIDHYEACGWVYGLSRKPVKDWRACVRTWKNRETKDEPPRIKGTDKQPVWMALGYDSEKEYLMEQQKKYVSDPQKIKQIITQSILKE